MATHSDDRGVPRQDHYGAGRQPWDDILDAGWAPEFATGNVLKYLRRTKDRTHSVESARWYWTRLKEMTRGDLTSTEISIDRLMRRAITVQKKLMRLLTTAELETLK